MRGLVLTSLQQFVTTTLGESAWPELLTAAGLQGRKYLASGTYPDGDVTALVSAASSHTGLPPMTSFGGSGNSWCPGCSRPTERS